ncbi:hypothetical protein BKA63DRAFT_593833 [Paraphoma chrysanthemicola]|nr:hypothetical protein BKA63DRAFT_593833 [Paraphoma chrysanthemicola]
MSSGDQDSGPKAHIPQYALSRNSVGDLQWTPPDGSQQLRDALFCAFPTIQDHEDRMHAAILRFYQEVTPTLDYLAVSYTPESSLRLQHDLQRAPLLPVASAGRDDDGKCDPNICQDNGLHKHGATQIDAVQGRPLPASSGTTTALSTIHMQEAQIDWLHPEAIESPLGGHYQDPADMHWQVAPSVLVGYQQAFDSQQIEISCQTNFSDFYTSSQQGAQATQPVTWLMPQNASCPGTSAQFYALQADATQCDPSMVPFFGPAASSTNVLQLYDAQEPRWDPSQTTFAADYSGS